MGFANFGKNGNFAKITICVCLYAYMLRAMPDPKFVCRSGNA